MEKTLESEYQEQEHREGLEFSPFKSTHDTPAVDFSRNALFGTGTFRLPSLEECQKPEHMRQYMNQLDVHVYKAFLYRLTRTIASLKFYADRIESELFESMQIQHTIEQLNQLREQAIHSKKVPEMMDDQSKMEYLKKHLEILEKAQLELPKYPTAVIIPRPY